MTKEFLTITYCGQFVDYKRLESGVYTTEMPSLFPIGTTIENLVDVLQAMPLHVIGFNSEKFIENLKHCELTSVVITA